MKNLEDLLGKFGLSENEAEVFVLLSKSDWITVLDLSRKTKIKRSTLYRILEALQDKGLIEVLVDDKTTYYKAASSKVFEGIITQKEAEISELRSVMGDLNANLKLLAGLGDHSKTGVRFYRGKAGIQALEWKMCEKGDSEIWAMGSDQWFNVVSQDFAEQIREERVAKNIKLREILNYDHADKTEADGTTSWTKNKEYALKCYLHRYVEKENLLIQNEINFLDDSIFLYSFQDDELVGIELVNKSYAQLMRQMFRLVWNQAKAVDGFGGDDL